MDRRNLIFFGDSICFGQGISPHKTWVSRISMEVERIFPDRWTVINTSINGNTTRMALERMAFDVQSHGLELMVLQFGMNDCNHWASDNGLPRVSRQAFKANLQEIIERAKKFGAKKIILNTSHPTPKTSKYDFVNLSYEESNAKYAEIVREVAKEDSLVILNDMRNSWEATINKGVALENLLLPDHIHLSEEGHGLYFETAAPIILNQVKELTR